MGLSCRFGCMNSFYLLVIPTLVGDTDMHVRETPSSKRFFTFLFFCALLLQVSSWMSTCQLIYQAEKVPSHRNSIEKQLYSINSYRESKHYPALQVFYLKLSFNSASHDFIFCLKTFEFIGKFQLIRSEGWGYFVLHLLTRSVKGFMRKECLLSSDTEGSYSLGSLSHY